MGGCLPPQLDEVIDLRATGANDAAYMDASLSLCPITCCVSVGASNMREG